MNTDCQMGFALPGFFIEITEYCHGNLGEVVAAWRAIRKHPGSVTMSANVLEREHAGEQACSRACFGASRANTARLDREHRCSCAAR
jgi:hypothetical protein